MLQLFLRYSNLRFINIEKIIKKMMFFSFKLSRLNLKYKLRHPGLEVKYEKVS
jgi:hypothetical protein